MNQIASLAACLLLISFIASPVLAKEPPKADNSAQNKGSARKNAITAEKQGNSKDEITVLAAVRKSVEAEKGLSMNAKNVKILFSFGVVTLRGPVDSEAEKSRIEALAKSCAGVNSVNNLITIAEKAHK